MTGPAARARPVRGDHVSGRGAVARGTFHALPAPCQSLQGAVNSLFTAKLLMTYAYYCNSTFLLYVSMDVPTHFGCRGGSRVLRRAAIPTSHLCGL